MFLRSTSPDRAKLSDRSVRGARRAREGHAARRIAFPRAGRARAVRDPAGPGSAPRAAKRTTLLRRDDRQLGAAMRVALFLTCVNDTLCPDTGRAVVKLLTRLGVDVDFPMDQTCCGQAHYTTGYRHEAEPLAEHFAKVFGEY